MAHAPFWKEKIDIWVSLIEDSMDSDKDINSKLHFDFAISGGRLRG